MALDNISSLKFFFKKNDKKEKGGKINSIIIDKPPQTPTRAGILKNNEDFIQEKRVKEINLITVQVSHLVVTMREIDPFHHRYIIQPAVSDRMTIIDR